ncbi:MAG: stage II sporulation protein R [Peptococcaceae bacterium]|nr:stage II sporulation protein R [Peptococcaceae bacterium]
MQKLAGLVALAGLVVCLGGWLTQNQNPADLAAAPQSLIRFHVLANSDSDADQLLKRQVRDAILAKFSPILAQSKSLEESRSLLKVNMPGMQKEAARVIAAKGKSYPVRVEYGHFDFPVKSYGNLTLPAGNYEAVRIIIGAGKGANWWCVLFPPLCFVDITSSLTAEPNSPQTMATPIVKFKTLEVVKNLLGI